MNEFNLKKNGRLQSCDSGTGPGGVPARLVGFCLCFPNPRVPHPRLRRPSNHCIDFVHSQIQTGLCGEPLRLHVELSPLELEPSAGVRRDVRRVCSPLKPPPPVHSVPFASLNPETCWFTLERVTEPSVAAVIDTDNSFAVFVSSVSSVSSCLSVERIKAFVFCFAFFTRERCLLSVALTACSACQGNGNEFINPKQFPKEY